MKRKSISIILALAVLGNQVGITTVSAEGFVSGESFAETDMQEYQTDDFVSDNADSKNDSSDSYKSDDSNSNSSFGKLNSEESTMGENGLEETYFGGKDSETTDQTTGSEGKENVGEGSEKYADISEKEVPEEIVNEQMESDETEDILDAEASSDLTYGDYKYGVSGNEVIITRYTGSASSLVIPAEIDGKVVKSIGYGAFRNCESLVVVDIPQGVEEIGIRAFSDCGKLKTISLPEGLKTIGGSFLSGTAVTSLTVPSTVTTITNYEGATNGAQELERVVFSSGMTRIPDYFCYNNAENTMLTDIEIPESVTEIGNSAFINCAGLKTVGLTGNVKKIGTHAFSYCESLVNINIPQGVEEIGEYAFSFCKNLEMINLPEGLKKIGSSFLAGTAVTSLTVPSTVEVGGNTYGGVTNQAEALESIVFTEGIKSIPSYFCNNWSVETALTHVEIPESVTEIGNSAFSHCTNLKTLELTGNIKKINKRAFSYCENLVSIDIPQGVEEIGEYAFSSCGNLKTINLPEGLKKIGSSFLAGTAVTSLTIPSTVEVGGNTYGGVTNQAEELESIIFTEGIKSIPSHFCNNWSVETALNHVEIPESVTEIGTSAFSHCTNLKTVELTGNVKRIDAYAFEDCKSLVSIDIPQGVEEIGYYAFSSCENLKTINLPEGLKRIGVGFMFGTAVTSLTVPSTVTTITDEINPVIGATYGALELKRVVFSDGMTKIPDYFCLETVLTDIEIPESVTEIGCSAFKGCTNLKTVELTGNVKKIDYDAFSFCKSLVDINIPQGVEEIGQYAFSGCINLKTINLPEGLKRIGSCFLSGTAVTSITIPSTVEFGGNTYSGVTNEAEALESIVFAKGITSIPDYFCYNNTSTQTAFSYVEIPESVTAIGTDAFYNCKSIKIYGYSGSYAETYALENGIPFVSLGEAIGNCEYDYSGQIDQWLLDQGTSNAMNYLVKDKNFTNSMAVATFDTDFGERLTEAWSNMLFRGTDGWREIFTRATSREQARDILIALLEEQSKKTQELADAEAAKKYADIYVKTLKQSNWAYAMAFGLNSEEMNQLSELSQKDIVKNYLLSGEYSSLSQYLQSVYGWKADSNAIKCIESFSKSKELAGTLSKGLEWMGTGLKLLSITEKTINAVYNVERLKLSDEMYAEMLAYIRDNCTFLAVSQAAGDLYTVINGGALSAISYALDDIKGETTDIAIDVALDSLVTKLPWVALVNTSYKFSVGLSNILFNIKDIQKQKDNMRCAAYIGSYIGKWMTDCRYKYLTGNADEKAKYSKRTVYAYYMLLKTRMAGEKSLQSMMSLSRTKWKRAYDVSLQISATLESNEKWLNSSGVLKKISTSMVACPVDVEIYDVSGNLVTTIYDGQETEGYIGDIYYSVSYNPISDDYVKTIRVPEDGGYSLKCVANDMGSVDYSLSVIGEDGSSIQQEVNNIPVESGNSIIISDISGKKTECVLKSDDNTGKEYTAQTPSEEYISVDSIQTEEKEVQIKTGEKKRTDIVILPENASAKAVNWSSSNPDIASVNADGVIVGKQEGDTIITAKAVNEDVSVQIAVHVKDGASAQEPSSTPIPEPSVEPVPSSTPTPMPEKEPVPSSTPTPMPDKEPVPSSIPTPEPGKTPGNNQTPIPTSTPIPKPELHVWSDWKTVQEADVFHPEVQERSCASCGEKEQQVIGSKLSPILKLNAAVVTLKVKQSTSGLKITQLQKGDSVVSWKSGNTKIVKVSPNGKLTAQKKTGKTTVTVTLKSGISKTITVKVQKKAVTTTKITGLKKNVVLIKGKTITLKPVRQPFTSTEKITYSSSNKKVATVTSKGKVKAVNKGKCKITVKAGKKKAYVTITVR